MGTKKIKSNPIYTVEGPGFSLPGADMAKIPAWQVTLSSLRMAFRHVSRFCGGSAVYAGCCFCTLSEDAGTPYMAATDGSRMLGIADLDPCPQTCASLATFPGFSAVVHKDAVRAACEIAAENSAVRIAATRRRMLLSGRKEDGEEFTVCADTLGDFPNLLVPLNLVNVASVPLARIESGALYAALSATNVKGKYARVRLQVESITSLSVYAFDCKAPQAKTGLLRRVEVYADTGWPAVLCQRFVELDYGTLVKSMGAYPRKSVLDLHLVPDRAIVEFTMTGTVPLQICRTLACGYQAPLFYAKNYGALSKVKSLLELAAGQENCPSVCPVCWRLLRKGEDACHPPAVMDPMFGDPAV